MKYTLSLLFIFVYSASFTQSLTENDIRKLANKITVELRGRDLGNGFTVRGCLAFGRTLVYQYDVSLDWSPPDNMKEDLISNFKESGHAETFFNNEINADFHYYLGNKLQRSISIKWNEFSNLNFTLGEFVSIKEHPKAKGVNLKIKQPIGWEIIEGDRPNIVKKFVYKNNSYMIIVKDNFTFFSRNEVKELLNSSEFKDEFIINSMTSLTNPEILNQRIITIDKYPTLEFTVSGRMERLGINMKMIMKNWMIFYEDKIVLLQCGGIDSKEFNTLEGLYFSITNSLIFPEQYNQ